MLPTTPVGAELPGDLSPTAAPGRPSPTAAPGGRPLPAPDPRLLRARTVVELVDAGFAALRQHPGLLLGTGVAFLLPVVALAAAIGEGSPTPGLVTAGSWPAGIVSVMGFSLASLLMGLPLARGVALRAAGEEPAWRRCYALPARIWAAAAAVWALLWAIRLVTSFLVVPLLLLPIFTLVLAPVLGLEELGPLAALRRAYGIGGAAFGRALGVVAAQLLAGLTATIGLGLLPLLLVLALDDVWQRPLGNLLQLAAGVLLCPPAAWTAASFYLDERIRREGLDLHRRLDAWDRPEVLWGPGGRSGRSGAAAGPGAAHDRG